MTRNMLLIVTQVKFFFYMKLILKEGKKSRKSCSELNLAQHFHTSLLIRLRVLCWFTMNESPSLVFESAFTSMKKSSCVINDLHLCTAGCVNILLLFCQNQKPDLYKRQSHNVCTCPSSPKLFILIS